MSLRFEELPRLIHCRLEPASLSGLLGHSTIDTRILNAGELFWALKGENIDGHDYVEDAFSKGACAAVVREDWFRRTEISISGASFIVVPDTLIALRDLARAHRSRFRIPVIALTGSNGKTATKELLAAALSSKYKLLKSPSNFNNDIGLPLTLLQITEETEMVLTEMGTNQPGDIEKLCGIAQPDHGMVLNVGPAHLEGFGDLAGVAKEKGTLLSLLPPAGTAFINCDDPYVRAMTSPAKMRICYGLGVGAPGADCSRILKADDLGLTGQGKGRFRLQDVVFSLSWYGSHQVRNALAAASVADHFGIPMEETARLFASLPQIEGRLMVDDIAGIMVIDDSYNANPASTAAALEFLHSIEISGKRYAVLGDHLELGRASWEEHRRVGRMLAGERLDGVFLVGPEMRHARAEIPDLVLFYLEDGSDLDPIIAEIVRIVRPGDALLVKASRGIELERIILGIRRYFNEGGG